MITYDHCHCPVVSAFSLFLGIRLRKAPCISLYLTALILYGILVPAPFSLQDLRKQAEKELAEAEEAQQKAAEAAARAGEEQLQQAQKVRCIQNGREMSRVAMEIEQNGVPLLFWVCLSKKYQKVM